MAGRPMAEAVGSRMAGVGANLEGSDVIPARETSTCRAGRRARATDAPFVLPMVLLSITHVQSGQSAFLERLAQIGDQPTGMLEGFLVPIRPFHRR